MELIDKSAVVAEIENLRKHYIEREDFDIGWNMALDKILSFLDTLEVKEVVESSNDLEEAAKFYAATHTEFFDSECKPHVAPAFKAGAKWYKEQLKDK